MTYICAYCTKEVETMDDFNNHACSGRSPKPFRIVEGYLIMTGPKIKTEFETKPAISCDLAAPGQDKTTFKKFDGGKRQWHLMPEKALEEVCKVLEYGACKYGDYNWLDHADEVKWTRYTNALERHLKKFKTGVNNDDESELPELAHIACNALMLLEYMLHKKGIDDRRKSTNKQTKGENENE